MNLIVPEREKTKDWAKGIILELKSIDGYSGQSRKIDRICYDYYYNYLESNRFDYFLNIGGSALPARPRHVPIQKHFIDSLASQQIYRPFVFGVVAASENMIMEKQFTKMQAMIGDIMSLAIQKYHSGIAKIQAINEKMSQMAQMANQQPKDEKEQVALQQLKQYVSIMSTQFNAIKEVLEIENKLSREEVDKLKRFYSYNYIDAREDIGQKLLAKLRDKLRIKSKSNKNFLNYIISGKEYYYVDLLEGEKWPRYEILDPIKVTFPMIENVECVSKGPWVKISERLSFSQISVQYGDDIAMEYGEDKLKELQELSLASSGSNNFVSTPGDNAMVNKGLYAGTFEDGQGTTVERVWFKVPRKVGIKVSPNPYEDKKVFQHFIEKNKIVINENDFIYKLGKFINKKDETIIYDKDEVEKYNPGKGQKIRNKYTNDIYQGIVINNDIIIRVQKKKYVYRPTDRHGDVCLPVFGPTFSSVTERPYSLIYATKDLQELYDIIHTQRELMLALAGTRSIIYDRAQKPSTMSDHEWEYQKKLGNIFVSTYDKDGHRIQSSFNQWAAVDLSLSPSIQYLNEMLAVLEDTMGNIIGVPRQRLGQVVNTDQVGTYKESINRSLLITEILYNKHDEIESRALSYLLNLTLQHGFKTGMLFEFKGHDGERGFFEFNPEMFLDCDFDLEVLNNSEQASKMNDLKDAAMLALKQGVLPFRDFVQVINTDNLVDLQKKVEFFTNEAMEVARKNRMEEIQGQEAAKQQTLQFAQEFEKYWRDQEAQLKQAKLMLDKAKIESDAILKQKDQAIAQAKLQTDATLRNKEIEAEQAMETAVLATNDKHSTIDEQLAAMSMRMDAIFNMMEMELRANEGDKAHHTDLEKIKVEKTKTRKLVGEQASDR